MALLAEAKRVAAEFELSDEDVRKVVVEFLDEMSASINTTIVQEVIFDEAQRRD